jgi:hypothetical protein
MAAAQKLTATARNLLALLSQRQAEEQALKQQQLQQVVAADASTGVVPQEGVTPTTVTPSTVTPPAPVGADLPLSPTTAAAAGGPFAPADAAAAAGVPQANTHKAAMAKPSLAQFRILHTQLAGARLRLPESKLLASAVEEGESVAAQAREALRARLPIGELNTLAAKAQNLLFHVPEVGQGFRGGGSLAGLTPQHSAAWWAHLLCLQLLKTLSGEQLSTILF